jgi:hypothetical protein
LPRNFEGEFFDDDQKESFEEQDEGHVLHEGREDLPDAGLVRRSVVDEPDGGTRGVGIEGAGTRIVGLNSDDDADLNNIHSYIRIFFLI